MHTVVIDFTLTDLTHAGYGDLCAELAPAFAALPGLLAKIWLADQDAARYGGVYLFTDAAAADAYLSSALFRTVRTSPHFTDLALRRFDVDEATTRRTQPGIAVLTPAAAAV